MSECATCDHPWCGQYTACCRADCPLVMLQGGNGRWQWTPRNALRDIPWPDGVRLGGRSDENWDHEDLQNE